MIFYPNAKKPLKKGRKSGFLSRNGCVWTRDIPSGPLF